MSNNKLRPSPSESATLFAIGTIKKGNDGNKWIVSSTNSGIHRWKVVQNNNILSNIKNLKKIGQINFTSKIGVGSVTYDIIKLKRGIYDIYKVDDNLMIIHADNGKINKDDIKNIKWKKQNFDVFVDYGTFGFFDVEIMDTIKKYDKTNKRKVNNKIPYTELNIDSYKHYDYANTDNLDFEVPDELVNYKFGIVANTGTGDGDFFCYTHNQDKALLLGGFTMMKLFDNNPNDMPDNLKYYKKHSK